MWNNPKSGHCMICMTAVVALLTLVSPPGFAQQKKKPLIKVVVTGGTIANTDAGRIPFQQVLSDMRKNFPETKEVLDSVQLDVVDLLRVGSEALSGADFLKIARTVNTLIQDPNVTGVIVTHGTSTSEETAFFLNLLVKSDKPVVLTNSQRHHGSVGNDGDKNFLDAIAVVLSPASTGKGAMVVQDQVINSGREVLKTSGHPDAFNSGAYGILGIIEHDRVDFYRSPVRRNTARSEFDVNAITVLPKVEVIYTYFDADPAMILAAEQAGVKGIVLDGFTPDGNPYITQLPALQALAKKGIPIVVTARGGMNNRVAHDDSNNFIKGDNFVAHKARILLQLALSKTSDFKEIQRIFDEY